MVESFSGIMVLKFLSAIGYSSRLDVKERFTYVVAAFSVAFVLLFFVFYLWVVQSVFVNLLTLFCLTEMLSVFVLLKYKKFYTAKILLLMGFFFQQSMLVFVWFPSDANFQYFFFIVTPITFFIFRIDQWKDRVILIFFNLLATIGLVASVQLPLNSPLIQLDKGIMTLFSTLTIICTILSIFIVYFFYAQTLKSIYQNLTIMADTDGLTETHNRRSLFYRGKEIFSFSRDNQQNFSFLIMDLDHFKEVNDRYGHLAGDEILKQVARVVQNNIRKSDLFARYGGEEFAILFQNTSSNSNYKTAEHLRKIIESHSFTLPEEGSISITCSIGVSYYTGQYQCFEDIVKAADKALYQAKANGRNQVILAGETP